MPPDGINSREFKADAAQARAGSVRFLRPSWHQSAKLRAVGWEPQNLRIRLASAFWHRLKREPFGGLVDPIRATAPCRQHATPPPRPAQRHLNEFYSHGLHLSQDKQLPPAHPTGEARLKHGARGSCRGSTPWPGCARSVPKILSAGAQAKSR
jgi:hypothetical protein